MKVALFIWAAALGAATAGTAYSARSALDARREAARASSHLAGVTADADELARLRSGSASPRGEARDASELPARLSATLSGCGLPSTAVQNFTAAPGRRTGPDRVRRQRATVVFNQITLPQVGRFLESWREAEPEWVVSSIELLPAGTAPGGGDIPLRVLLSLEAVTPEPSGDRS